jgi:hypothetical protein
MRKRPLAVSIFSCLFIVTGVVGLIRHLADYKASQLFAYDLVWIFIVELAAILCGAFMLRGNNWARWLALAWMGFHVVLSFFQSLREVGVHGLLFALIAYFLFRPEARAYFSPPGKDGSLDSKPQPNRSAS